MEDLIKSEFVRNFELSLFDYISCDEIKKVVDALYVTLKDYSLEKIGTELIVYEHHNEKLLNEFGACLIIQGKSKGTVKQYIRALTKLCDFTGKDLEANSTNDIRGFLAQGLMNGQKKVTINNSRNYISSFYKWAHAEGIINENPCSNVLAVKCEKEIKYPYSDIEVDRMRNHIHNLRDRAIFEVLLSSGIRINELTNLDISDIDIENGKLTVRQGKGGKDRITYLSRVACYHIRLYLNSRHDNNIALFLNYTNRSEAYQDRISNSGVRKMLYELSSEIGVNNIHPHRFRRTFATSLYQRGMSIVDIQRLLGHSEVNTTMTYIYCDDNNLKSSYLKYAM